MDPTVERADLRFAVVVFAAWRGAHLLALVAMGGDPGTDPFRFDGGWFLELLRHGYEVTDPTWATQQGVAFFPGLTWLTEPFSWVLGARGGAVLVANLTALTAFLAVAAAVGAVVSRRAARLAVVGLALWPASLVLTAYYSEGLFITLTALAIWCERTDRHRAGPAVALLAATTRSVGLVLGPAIALVRVARTRRLDRRSVLYAVAGPLGTGLVTLVQHHQVGDGFAWLHAQEAWDRGLAGPWVPIWRALDGIADKLPTPALELSLNLAAIVVVGVGLALATLRWRGDDRRWPLLAWGWCAWLVPLLTTVPSSQVRFALAAWPFLAAVDVTEPASGSSRTRRAVLLSVVTAMVAMSAVLVHRWTHGHFVA